MPTILGSPWPITQWQIAWMSESTSRQTVMATVDDNFLTLDAIFSGLIFCILEVWDNSRNLFSIFLARWLTSARAYRIGGRKLCPSVCLYVKRYLLLQFCTDYNQTWINMIWAVAAKTWLSQIFHKWRKIEVNCVYISRCAQLVSYFWNAGMHTK